MLSPFSFWRLLNSVCSSQRACFCHSPGSATINFWWLLEMLTGRVRGSEIACSQVKWQPSKTTTCARGAASCLTGACMRGFRRPGADPELGKEALGLKLSGREWWKDISSIVMFTQWGRRRFGWDSIGHSQGLSLSRVCLWENGT